MHKNPFIATPVMDGKPFCNYVQSMVLSTAELMARDYEFRYVILPNNALVDNARNVLLHKFLESDCDCIIWIDADVGWQPNDLIKLLESPYDCIGGVYPKKGQEEGYPVRLVKKGETTEEGYREAEYLPGGFTKFSRESIERVIEEFGDDAKAIYDIHKQPTNVYHIYATGIGPQGLYCGEDVAICNALHQVGYKLYVDPSIVLSHAGFFIWQSSYAEWLSENEES